jgi:hypothetical protein
LEERVAGSERENDKTRSTLTSFPSKYFRETFAMGFAKIFHLIAVVHFGFGLWYDRTYMTAPDNAFRKFEFGGRMSELCGDNYYFGI